MESDQVAAIYMSIIMQILRCKKMTFSIKDVRPNLQFTVDLVIFTEEMLIRKLHFLYRVSRHFVELHHADYHVSFMFE